MTILAILRRSIHPRNSTSLSPTRLAVTQVFPRGRRRWTGRHIRRGTFIRLLLYVPGFRRNRRVRVTNIHAQLCIRRGRRRGSILNGRTGGGKSRGWQRNSGCKCRCRRRTCCMCMRRRRGLGHRLSRFVVQYPAQRHPSLLPTPSYGIGVVNYLLHTTCKRLGTIAVGGNPRSRFTNKSSSPLYPLIIFLSCCAAAEKEN